MDFCNFKRISLQVESDTESNKQVNKLEVDEDVINKSKFDKYYSYSERSESIESEEITSSLSSSKNSDSSEAYKIKVNDMQNDNISIEDIVNLSKIKRKTFSQDLADSFNSFPSASNLHNYKRINLENNQNMLDNKNIIMENEERNTESNDEAMVSNMSDYNKIKDAKETINSESGSLPSKFKHIMPIKCIKKSWERWGGSSWAGGIGRSIGSS